MRVCLWVCLTSHSAIPHTVNWWRALASKSFQCVYVWSPRMLRSSTSAALTQTYMPGNLHNSPSLLLTLTSCQYDEDHEFCAFWEWLLYLWVAAFVHFWKCFCVVFKRTRKIEEERSGDRMNEFAGHKWFIVQRERVREREREREATFQSLSLISKMGLEISSLTEPK